MRSRSNGPWPTSSLRHPRRATSPHGCAASWGVPHTGFEPVLPPSAGGNVACNVVFLSPTEALLCWSDEGLDTLDRRPVLLPPFSERWRGQARATDAAGQVCGEALGTRCERERE